MNAAVRTPTEAALIAEFAAWCRAETLPHWSADELLSMLYPETEGEDTDQRIAQRAWLRAFIVRWDATLEMGAAA